MYTRAPYILLLVGISAACGDSQPAGRLQVQGKWLPAHPESSASPREQGHALRIYATADHNRERTDDEVMVRMDGLIAPDALGTFEIQGDVRVEREYPLQVWDLDRPMGCSVLDAAQWPAEVGYVCIDLYQLGFGEYDAFSERVSGSLVIERHDERRISGRVELSARGLDLLAGPTGAAPAEEDLSSLDQDILFGEGAQLVVPFDAELE